MIKIVSLIKKVFSILCFFVMVSSFCMEKSNESNSHLSSQPDSQNNSPRLEQRILHRKPSTPTFLRVRSQSQKHLVEPASFTVAKKVIERRKSCGETGSRFSKIKSEPGQKRNFYNAARKKREKMNKSEPTQKS